MNAFILACAILTSPVFDHADPQFDATACEACARAADPYRVDVRLYRFRWRFWHWWRPWE